MEKNRSDNEIQKKQRYKTNICDLSVVWIYIFLNFIYLFICLFIYFFFFFAAALRPNVGHGLLIRSHTTTHQSVGLLWTSDQLVTETSTWQHTTLTTNIHAPSGIWTHDLSRRAAADLRLRPRGHWDQQIYVLYRIKIMNHKDRLCCNL